MLSFVHFWANILVLLGLLTRIVYMMYVMEVHFRVLREMYVDEC
jgi:hypothetical protein